MKKLWQILVKIQENNNILLLHDFYFAVFIL